jgi:hypothetical protein
MIDWMVDYSVEVVAALVCCAAILAAVWWNTRHKLPLIGAGVSLALMALVIVLSLVVVTDSAKLKRNVASIRDAVNGRKFDDALNFFDDKVKITGMSGTMDLSKDQILKMANRTKDNYQVKQIDTGKVDVEELDRTHAKISFMVWDADDVVKRGLCKMRCELKQGKWVVTTMSVEAPIGGRPMPVLLLPGAQ